MYGELEITNAREPCISAEQDLVEFNDDNLNNVDGNNTNVVSKENIEEVGDQEKETMGIEHEKETMTASVDMQNNEAGLASEQGGDETITTKEVLLVPKKKVLKRKKVVVKKRRLVKGKVAETKDEEKPQSSEMPDPSVEVRTNQNVNKSSSTVNAKSKDAQEITETVSVKSEQSEKNKQAEKDKTTSVSENKLSSIKAQKGNLGEATAEDKDEAEPSKKNESTKKMDSMGLIFMCSSKTKEDCYRYKILGLPASKKDLVLKIYKGMRLFLFDVDLKVLYGIYKADAPGGYNIEPNAFKSNFPAQVRFSVVHEHTPVPEEKFRTVIKNNYYTKNKFHPELNSDQVKSLCKLFQLASKAAKSKSKAINETPKVGIRPTVGQENKKRARIENDDRGKNNRRIVDSERDSKRRRVDEVKRSSANGNAKPLRSKDDVRRPRGNGDVKRRRHEDDRKRLRLEEDARRRIRLEDEPRRRIRLEDEARRRMRLEDEARRSRIAEESRFSRLEDEERHLRLVDEERRSRLVDEERHSRLVDEERRSRLVDEERRSRLVDEERRSRLEEEERRIRVEADIRRLLADDRRNTDIYERESRLPSTHLPSTHLPSTHLPSTLTAPLYPNALPPPAASLYTSSYTGRSSVLDGNILDRTVDLEDRSLAYTRPRSLYEIESRDPYLSYREPVIDYRDPGYAALSSRQSYYSPAEARDEYLPSTNRTSGYRRY